jgi:hypothetical protein
MFSAAFLPFVYVLALYTVYEPVFLRVDIALGAQLQSNLKPLVLRRD